MCLEPASGLPSFSLYRGSLLVLLIGAALAAWLILQPPGDSTSATLPFVTATPSVQETPGATQTPGADETPAPGETPGADTTPEPDEPATTTHTVQPGDTLFSICVANSSMNPQECVEEVLELNNLSDPGSLSPGQTLTIPE